MLELIDTDKKIYGRITALIRKVWMTYSSERKDKIINNRKHLLNPKTGNIKYYCICERCGKPIIDDKYQVHHINPVGSIKDGADVYFTRMFCSKDNLMILDKECHKVIHKELKDYAKKETRNK